MTITETNKSFEIKFTFDYFKVKAIKDIPGAWFTGNDKTWHVPLYRTREIDRLKEKFGLRDPHDAAILAPEQIDEVPPLPELTGDPGLPRELFSFQKTGVAYILQHKRVIVGDQPGLGKTTQAIAATCMASAFPCLIICPSTIKLNWQKEWLEVAGKKSMILTDKVKNTWPQYSKVGMIDVFITNYESLKKYFVQSIQKPDKGGLKLKDITFRETISLFKSVIVDESHKCKDGSTQQSKFVMGITRGKEYIMELTGTPVVNKPKDLIPQLHILGRLGEVVAHIPPAPNKKDSGYSRFINRYCGGGNDATNLKELNYRLATTCFYRREKTEVLKDLPAKIRQVVLCEISNRDEYSKAENEFVQYLKEMKGCTDVEIDRKLRGQFMVKMGILKQISARGKINSVKEYVNEVIESGEKIILFCHLKEVAAALKEAYPTAATIRGDDDAFHRQQSIERFQKDPRVQIIICSIKAAGVGITLTASSRVAFVEFPWTFADCEQCEDRAHRIGQKDSVQCSYFLGEDTIDRYCYEIIQKKKSIARDITGASDDVHEEVIDELLSLFNHR